METSVGVQDANGLPLWVTQQASVFTDSVSVAHGNGTDICGGRAYAITSYLSTTELTIDSTSGLIALYTANS